MNRSLICAAATLLALAGCQDANVLAPPLAQHIVDPPPECFGKPATIYPDHPGAGTIAPYGGGGVEITGTPGNDVIVGSTDRDRISGGLGRDLICTGGGDDLLVPADGKTGDKYDGGSGLVGSATLDFSGWTTRVTVDLSRGRAGGNVVIAIHNINGTQFDDVLRGSNYVDNLNGLGGNDRIYGGEMGDHLSGGNGDDIIYPGTGGGFMEGGSGTDVINFFDVGYVVIDLDRMEAYPNGEFQEIFSFENAVGSPGDDYIAGDGGPNTLSGLGGHDQIFGGGADDAISGGDGNDALDGGSGNDNLNGGPGEDRVYGDAGDDILIGGDGGDALYGNAGNDVLKAGSGFNSIDGGDGTDAAGRVSCLEVPTDVETYTHGACPSVLLSTITAHDTTIAGSPTNHTTIRVVLKDIYTNKVIKRSGVATVFFSTSGGAFHDGIFTSPVIYGVPQADGSYTAELYVGTTGGTITLGASVNDELLTDTATVDVIVD